MFTDGLQSFQAGLVPARDKNQTTSYVVPRYDRAQLNAIYRTSLGGRIIDQRAEDSFREWREWQAKGVDISKIEALEKRLGLKQKMEHAQKLADLYGVAYVVIHTTDADHSEPINLNAIRPGSIRKLHVFEKGDIGEGPLGVDALGDYYDQPEYYQVLSNNSEGVLNIHPSRVVVLFGTKRLDQWGGDSVLLRGMDALKNMDAGYANVASLIWEAKIDVLSIKGLVDSVRDPLEEKATLDRINLAMFSKGNNGALILDAEGEEYDQKTISFATLPELIETFENAVASAFDYPRSILFTDNSGGLNNTGRSSLENYYNSVASNQANVIEPAMAILDECLIRDALGTRPDEVWYTWKPLWSLTDKEIAEIGKITTETFAMAHREGIVEVNVANQAWVNRMTESGAAPGLEALNAGFIGSLGGELDEDSGDGDDE